LRQRIKQTPVLGDLAKRLYHRYKVQKLRRIFRTISPVKIVVGPSGVFDEGWIPLEIDYLDLLNRKDWETYFRSDSIDIILAEHVWEHLTPEEGAIAARHCYRYLKPGGYLRAAVPDGCHPDPEYIEWVKVGGVGPGAQDHKVLYDHETFSALFEQAGFEVQMLEYFDSEHRFHCTEWNAEGGNIRRSKRFDERNAGGELRYTSIILDAHKPAGS